MPTASPVPAAPPGRAAVRAPVPTPTGRRVVGAACWLAVVAVGLVWGTVWIADRGVGLRAAPLVGHWDWRLGAGLLPALALAGAWVAWGSRLVDRVPWRALPWLVGSVAVAWTVALAASDGWDRLTEPLTNVHEYEPYAARVDDLGALLRTYVDRQPDLPIHLQSHPPGPVVVAWTLDGMGLGGAGWLAGLVITGWGVAAGAALVATRALAGEPSARRVAPVLALLPAAIWAGTSADALFAGVAGVAIALIALAATTPAQPLRWVGAGVALGVALLLTYGAGLAVLVAAGVIAVRARPVLPPLALVAAGAITVLALAATEGFWWPDGLAATREAYWAGIAAERPGPYLSLAGNPAVLALATGPAVAAGLASWRVDGHRAARLLPALALVVLLVADVSQFSRGEVERLWLPFVPWVALAAAPGRWWLGAQAAVALALQATLVSPW